MSKSMLCSSASNILQHICLRNISHFLQFSLYLLNKENKTYTKQAAIAVAGQMWCSIQHYLILQESSNDKWKVLCINVFIIVCIHVSFLNGTVYLPTGTLILVMALANANPVGSTVPLGNYTLLFGKVMHFCMYVNMCDKK